LCTLLAQDALPADIVFIADRAMLGERAATLGVEFDVPAYHPDVQAKFSVLHLPLRARAAPGRLDPSNSGAVLETIKRAAKGCLSGEFDALVTAPVHKGVINEAGIVFSGHTEFLAELTSTEHVVMMLAGGGMRVALATTHLPLKDVPGAITRESLERTMRILHHDLEKRFRINHPRIAVTGLNPHAGESGYLGLEEIEIIEPAIASMKQSRLDFEGPFPADTLFSHLEGFDCVLAMYHDQGLPVLKYASFGKGVNVTLGLPIVRTSVDHGTALALAGTGKIDEGSLRVAIETAMEMVGK
jgi:4-hydroxythreonine-4-phosphate dehydrogenase